jgi:hypothetical protein
VTSSFRFPSKGKDHTKQSQYWWSTLFVFYTQNILLVHTKVTAVLSQDAILNISLAQTFSSFRTTIYSSGSQAFLVRGAL